MNTIYSYQYRILAIVGTQIDLVLTFSSLGEVSAVVFHFSYCNCAQICDAWLACIHCISSCLSVCIYHASSGHPCVHLCWNTQETTASAGIRSPSGPLLTCTKGRTHPANRELVYRRAHWCICTYRCWHDGTVIPRWYLSVLLLVTREVIGWWLQYSFSFPRSLWRIVPASQCPGGIYCCLAEVSNSPLGIETWTRGSFQLYWAWRSFSWTKLLFYPDAYMHPRILDLVFGKLLDAQVLSRGTAR